MIECSIGVWRLIFICDCVDPGQFDSAGFSIGYKLTCLVDSNLGSLPPCCSGSRYTPAICPSFGVSICEC